MLQLCAECPDLWTEASLEVTLFCYKPSSFSHVNDHCHMWLVLWEYYLLHLKSRKVCSITRSPSASPLFLKARHWARNCKKACCSSCGSLMTSSALVLPPQRNEIPPPKNRPILVLNFNFNNCASTSSRYSPGFFPGHLFFFFVVFFFSFFFRDMKYYFIVTIMFLCATRP